MFLEQYLGEGKMELFKQKVESSTRMQLKITLQWLIQENRLRERQESDNNQGSAIVITIANAFDVAYLYARGLRFGRALKVVQKYQEAELK